MARNTVEIQIIVEDDGSVKFKTVGKEAEKAAKKIETKFKRAGQAFSDFGNKLTLGVTLPIVAVGAVAVKAALEADRMRKSLEGLAGGADEAAEFIEAIQDASLGTISSMDAMAIASKGLSLNVVENADKMADLTEIAITLGRAQGLSAKQAVDDLTTALGRQSPMILDNLGITLKMSEAHGLYADQLGKSVDDLSEAEKQQAFLNAALIKGGEVAARLGGVQEDAAAKTERFAATLADAKVTLGEGLIPVFETAMGVIQPIIQGFAEMDEGTRSLVLGLGAAAAAAGPAFKIIGKGADITTSVASAMVGMGKSMLGLPGKIKEVAAAMQLLRGGAAASQVASLGLSGLAAVAIPIAAVAVSLVGVAVASKKFSDKVEQGMRDAESATDDWAAEAVAAMSEGAELGNVMQTLAKRANAVSEELHADGNALEDVGRSIIRTRKQTAIFNAVTDKTQRIALSAAGSYVEYVRAINDYNASTTDSAALTQIVTEQQFNLLTNIDAVTSSMFGFADAFFGASEAQQGFITSQEELLTGTDKHITRLEAEAEVMEKGNTRLGTRLQLEMAEADSIAFIAEQKANLTNQDEAAAEAAAAAAERRVASSAAITSALAREEEAARRTAEAQGALALKLNEATEETFKQALLAELDPAELGAEAYAAVAVELGLLDEEAGLLAAAMPELVGAIESGVIPLENIDEAASAFFAAAEEGIIPTGEILDQFATMPGLIGPSVEVAKKFGLAAEDIVEVAPKLSSGIEFTGTAAEKTAPQLAFLAEMALAAAAAYREMATAQVFSDQLGTPTANPFGVPEFQRGGVVPGPIGAPRLIMAHGGEQVLPVGTTNHFGLTVNTSMPSVDVIGEFNMMKAFANA